MAFIEKASGTKEPVEGAELPCHNRQRCFDKCVTELEAKRQTAVSQPVVQRSFGTEQAQACA